MVIYHTKVEARAPKTRISWSTSRRGARANRYVRTPGASRDVADGGVLGVAARTPRRGRDPDPTRRPGPGAGFGSGPGGQDVAPQTGRARRLRQRRRVAGRAGAPPRHRPP